MPLDKKDLIASKRNAFPAIYLEEKGTLSERIDFAWSAYTDKKSTRQEKKEAFKFLLYAFDLSDTKDVNLQLITLMEAKKKVNELNQEFIPGKTFKNLPLDPTIRLEKTDKYGNSLIEEVFQAINSNEMLDVIDTSKLLDRDVGTKMFNAEERAVYRVNIQKGLFKRNGEVFDTFSMTSHDKRDYGAYTINIHGEISVFNHYGMSDFIAHSSMNAGVPVVAAGEIKIENGVLKEINCHSGHYRPSLFNVARALEHFSNHNVDLSHAQVMTELVPEFSSKSLQSCKEMYHQVYEEQVYYTPATVIYKNFEKLIDENVRSIDIQLQTYTRRGLRSTLYQLKDLLPGSSGLTKKRKELAQEFEIRLLIFKTSLNDISPGELPAKMEELEQSINSYEERNEALSAQANKKAFNGRLADSMKDFKEKLTTMKDYAEDAKKQEESHESMKKIH